MQQEEQFPMEIKSFFEGGGGGEAGKGKERHVNIENTEKEFHCL